MQRRAAQQSSSQEVVDRRKDSNPATRQTLRQANKAHGDTGMRGDDPKLNIPPHLCPINLGQTKLNEYTKLSVLGKGSYGEVHKCVHTPTGSIVAMKTYIFEVSSAQVFNLSLERDKWDKLLNDARDQLAETACDPRLICQITRHPGG